MRSSNAGLGSQFVKHRNSLGKEMAYAVSVLQGVADEASQMQKPNEQWEHD